MRDGVSAEGGGVPELHPKPVQLYGEGSSVLREPDRVGDVSAEKLVPVNCNATHVVSSEAGRVRLYCTEKKRHRGDHYDTIFSVGWPRVRKSG